MTQDTSEVEAVHHDIDLGAVRPRNAEGAAQRLPSARRKPTARIGIMKPVVHLVVSSEAEYVDSLTAPGDDRGRAGERPTQAFPSAPTALPPVVVHLIVRSHRDDIESSRIPGD